MLNPLNRDMLDDQQQVKFDDMKQSPVTLLQIGEGVFLRGFVDWMIQACRDQGLFPGSMAVVQPRPSGKAKIKTLAEQEGIYTLVVRGLEHGKQVERQEIISVFSRVFDPYSDWEQWMEIARSPELRFVVSNTTEAGITYQPEPLTDGPILSFPGKMCHLLYTRYVTFDGDADKGLIFLPCELLERNGDSLRSAVLRFADDWQFSAAFVQWVLTHNRFLNSLVDRIVTGYPSHEQADRWFSEWGYRDDMLNTTEPYYFWAIEGEEALDQLLPFRQAGLNVCWTDNLTLYQQRKVRILNGAHSWMAPLGVLYDMYTVKDVLDNDSLGTRLHEMIFQDIIPTLPYPQQDMEDYAHDIMERFANPYIEHRLLDITMNSLSKYKTRILPSLAYYEQMGQTLPHHLVCGLAGLLRLYQVKHTADSEFIGTSFSGKAYQVKDDATALSNIAQIWELAAINAQPLLHTICIILSDERLWDQDLTRWHGLVDGIVACMESWDMRENK